MTALRKNEMNRWEEIELRLRRLTTPRNYLAGRETKAPLQPRNILLFQRKRQMDLETGPASRRQHHRYVLITAIRTSGVIGINTRTHYLKEGQSLLILPFQAHWYERLSSPTMLWSFVTFEHEKDARLEVLRDRGGIDGGEGGMEGIRDVLRCWQNSFQEDLLGARLGVWLHALALTAKKRKKVQTRGTPTSPDGEWMVEINRYILEHRGRALTVEEVAEGLKISTSLLRSKFRRLAGYSIGRHVRELKLQHACELLHDTRLRINEVAERCGYDSLFSFSRAFRNCFRISPSGYRKKLAV